LYINLQNILSLFLLLDACSSCLRRRPRHCLRRSDRLCRRRPRSRVRPLYLPPRSYLNPPLSQLKRTTPLKARVDQVSKARVHYTCTHSWQPLFFSSECPGQLSFDHLYCADATKRLSKKPSGTGHGCLRPLERAGDMEWEAGGMLVKNRRCGRLGLGRTGRRLTFTRRRKYMTKKRRFGMGFCRYQQPTSTPFTMPPNLAPTTQQHQQPPLPTVAIRLSTRDPSSHGDVMPPHPTPPAPLRPLSTSAQLVLPPHPLQPQLQ